MLKEGSLKGKIYLAKQEAEPVIREIVNGANIATLVQSLHRKIDVFARKQPKK